MRILGVDQSQMGEAGFVVVELGEPPLLLHSHLETYRYRDEKGTDRPLHSKRRRCMRFAKVFRGLVQAWKPDVVVTEMVRGYQDGKRDTTTIARLSSLTGIVFILTPKDTPVIELNTNSWQRVTINLLKTEECKGMDTKQLSVFLLKKIYNIVLEEHRADAYWMCLAYPILLEEQTSTIGTVKKNTIIVVNI